MNIRSTSNCGRLGKVILQEAHFATHGVSLVNRAAYFGFLLTSNVSSMGWMTVAPAWPWQMLSRRSLISHKATFGDHCQEYWYREKAVYSTSLVTVFIIRYLVMSHLKGFKSSLDSRKIVFPWLRLVTPMFLINLRTISFRKSVVSWDASGCAKCLI